ncbi:NmrA family NAD(P)-binding protein [Nonomuraea ferruginea]
MSVVKPDTRLSLAAVDDIGRAAAAAIAEPERFHGVELELASDYLSMTEIAEVLSRALGTHLSAPDMTEEQALAVGMPAMGASHEWMNIASQPLARSTPGTSVSRSPASRNGLGSTCGSRLDQRRPPSCLASPGPGPHPCPAIVLLISASRWPATPDSCLTCLTRLKASDQPFRSSTKISPADRGPVCAS